MRGRGRSPVLIGLALVMVLGIAVYYRLWVIDYRISSNEAELLRRQFDSANREAMEESAEWRLRYDEEVVKSRKCAAELIKVRLFIPDAINWTSSRSRGQYRSFYGSITSHVSSSRAALDSLEWISCCLQEV